MKDFTVVTGASGNVGRQVAKALLATRQVTRVVARTAEKLKPLGDLGAEISPSSLDDRKFLTGALQRARAASAMSALYARMGGAQPASPKNTHSPPRW